MNSVPVDNIKLRVLFYNSQHWPNNDKVGPICVHAEENVVAQLILFASKRPLHVCHVARRSELELIKMAKELGYPITCEVCPHHLFFTEEDVETKLGDKKGQVRPCLSTKEDREFLLKNLEYIDTIGSDHAPHTVEEKTGKNGKSIILDI